MKIDYGEERVNVYIKSHYCLVNMAKKTHEATTEAMILSMFSIDALKPIFKKLRITRQQLNKTKTPSKMIALLRAKGFTEGLYFHFDNVIFLT